jgi:hypothetical protein
MRCPSSEVVRNLFIGGRSSGYAQRTSQNTPTAAQSILAVRPAKLTRRPTDPQDRTLGVTAFPPEHLISVLYSRSDRHAFFFATCKDPCQAIASSSETAALPLPSQSAGRAQPRITGRIVDEDVRGGALAGRQGDVATSKGDLSAADGPSARWVPAPRVMGSSSEGTLRRHSSTPPAAKRPIRPGVDGSLPADAHELRLFQSEPVAKFLQRPDHLTENYLYR